jgi:hypothetical protein
MAARLVPSHLNCKKARGESAQVYFGWRGSAINMGIDGLDADGKWGIRLAGQRKIGNRRPVHAALLCLVAAVVDSGPSENAAPDRGGPGPERGRLSPSDG